MYFSAAERKEKHFGGKFFENINKVVNIASSLAQKSHKKPGKMILLFKTTFNSEEKSNDIHIWPLICH